MTTVLKIEHIEDLTAHEWCNALLSDPSIASIEKRRIHHEREGVSNTFFTRTLFTDGAIRAFLSLYRPGKGQRRLIDDSGGTTFTGSTPTQEELASRSNDTEAQRQAKKQDITHNTADADAPESIILVSLGSDVDGGVHRLHGGVTASLLDQAMGYLLTHVFEITSATVELNVKYKKPVTTPCVLCVRAKIKRESGRWVETVGWVEDGLGVVFAEGEGSFVLGKVGGSKI
jgi:acyl-coenzyme A thioesterase PaaI-like protein